MMNINQATYLLGEADNIILRLLTQIIKDHPVETLQNDFESADVLDMVAEATAWADALRYVNGLPMIMGDDEDTPALTPDEQLAMALLSALMKP